MKLSLPFFRLISTVAFAVFLSHAQIVNAESADSEIAEIPQIKNVALAVDSIFEQMRKSHESEIKSHPSLAELFSLQKRELVVAEQRSFVKSMLMKELSESEIHELSRIFKSPVMQKYQRINQTNFGPGHSAKGPLSQYLIEADNKFREIAKKPASH
jgi:hypothetical protein